MTNYQYFGKLKAGIRVLIQMTLMEYHPGMGDFVSKLQNLLTEVEELEAKSKEDAKQLELPLDASLNLDYSYVKSDFS